MIFVRLFLLANIFLYGASACAMEALGKFCNAIKRGDDARAISLINDINPPFLTDALLKAMNYQKEEVVDSLLERKINLNISGISGGLPLVSAVRNGNIERVKKLLEHDADPNAYSRIGFEREGPAIITAFGKYEGEKQRELLTLLITYDKNKEQKRYLHHKPYLRAEEIALLEELYAEFDK